MDDNIGISYTTNERKRIISESAKMYKENFADKNILILLKNGRNEFSSFEIDASPHNFLHLTGVRRQCDANAFFDKALKEDLLDNEVVPKSNLTDMKLSVLKRAMTLEHEIKIGGIFAPHALSKELLSNIVIGNGDFALGFMPDKESGGQYYVPNTILKCNAREYMKDISNVYAIFTKGKKETEYKNLLYISKQGMNDGLSKDSWNVEKLAGLRISKKIIARITGANKPPKQNNSETIDENTRENISNPNNNMERVSQENQKKQIMECKKIGVEVTQIVDDKIRQDQQAQQAEQVRQVEQVQQVQPSVPTQRSEQPRQNNGGNNRNQGKPRQNDK